MKVKGMDVAYGSPSITYGKSQGGPQAYSQTGSHRAEREPFLKWIPPEKPQALTPPPSCPAVPAFFGRTCHLPPKLRRSLFVQPGLLVNHSHTQL